MLRKLSKHIKLFSKIFLSVYLAFLTVAVFHSHNIDIDFHHSFQIIESNATKTYADPFLDDQANCKLNKFAHSISNKHNSSDEILIRIPRFKKLIVTDSLPKLSSIFSFNFNHRAPPQNI